jgi:hypothetical protein
MNAAPISFVMQDDSDGYAIGPDRVPLGTLRGFARDVDELARGDSGEIDSLEVAIKRGSLELRTSPIANSELRRDLAALASSALLDRVNPKRRAVIERWQKAAKVKGRRVRFVISAKFLPNAIVVDSTTDFRTEDADRWVRVERYLRGEVFEAGGITPNVHIRLPNGEKLIVSAKMEMLRGDPTNRLFKHAMIRFQAEYNILTREYRNARLIEFGDYDRTPDDEQLARLIERGTQAWSGVGNATEWVDNLRGGEG